MSKKIINNFLKKPKIKRKGIHSKNASKGQKGFIKKYKGQGK
tara:strand:+ start:473 stop:598 length:126 start_codon:yes stop_codon:yes gene_type:complete